MWDFLTFELRITEKGLYYFHGHRLEFISALLNNKNKGIRWISRPNRSSLSGGVCLFAKALQPRANFC